MLEADQHDRDRVSSGAPDRQSGCERSDQGQLKGERERNKKRGELERAKEEENI